MICHCPLVSIDSLHGFARNGINPPHLYPCQPLPLDFSHLLLPGDTPRETLYKCQCTEKLLLKESQPSAKAHGVLPGLFYPLCHSSGGSWKCNSDLRLALLTQRWVCASVVCNWNSVGLGWQNICLVCMCPNSVKGVIHNVVQHRSI